MTPNLSEEIQRELCMVGRRSLVIGLHPSDDDHLFDRSATVDLLHVVKLEPLDRTERAAGERAR